ncbi:hypothetical protein [Acetivibrio cellulolyticus]|uniref:hypothetical protein n=1 Tax=Acetivibrio cellulolyticus TaxID=35830 RepID=UPI0001E2F0ED|nr:hypothetical protein [Acetivibrio cellulolyticus]
MENATKAIIIAAAVLITMAIVTIGFFIMNSGKDAATNAVTNINSMNNKLAESEYTMYDNMTVTGNDVVSAIEKVESSKDYIGILVVTGVGGTTQSNWYAYNASNINALSSASKTVEDAEDIEAPSTYINPAGRFKGEVARDNNGRIASITFTQQ